MGVIEWSLLWPPSYIPLSLDNRCNDYPAHHALSSSIRHHHHWTLGAALEFPFANNFHRWIIEYHSIHILHLYLVYTTWLNVSFLQLFCNHILVWLIQYLRYKCDLLKYPHIFLLNFRFQIVLHRQLMEFWLRFSVVMLLMLFGKNLTRKLLIYVWLHWRTCFQNRLFASFIQLCVLMWLRVLNDNL